MPSLKEGDAYLNTVDRIEPDIHPLDQDGSLASIAISLKRIADTMAFFHAVVHHGLTLAGENEPDALEVLKRAYGKG